MAHDGLGQVEFQVLGPLRITAAGQPAAVSTARKRRLVLAALLARAGQPVPVDTLVEAVWGERPPASARRNLQLYVHGFRRILGPGLINTSGDSYLIDPGTNLDAVQFRRLVADGGAALDSGDPVTAEATLHAALDLWQGQAFAEFLDCRLVADEAQWLELLRLECYERWAEAQLVTGATPALAAELTRLCRLHPYRETLRAHLMRALHQTGRQAEALAVFRQTRALLADQLGVEPGSELQRLHQAILRGEEIPAPGAGTGPAAVSIVPRELPPGPAVFTGRGAALTLLDESLPGPDRPARPVVICGLAGVGKTTLVVNWAHRVADRFPDGQLYADLRGLAPDAPMGPVEALGRLLGGLGVPAGQIPVELAAATGMYRTRLAGRRMLIVLDNAREAEQVRPLLPATPGCLALVTSRDRMTGLVARDGARRLALDVLTPAEAATLIGQLAQHLPARPAAADLARACGYLPLAIRIAVAHLADRPGLAIADYIAALRGGSGLDALEAGGDPEASVRSAFAHSYRALDPPAGRLFRLLGLIPGPEATPRAAAALADADPAQAQRLLDTLARAHLVNPGQPGRYAWHDLLRAYAGELVQAADEPERKDAATRLHDFYLAAVDAAARMLYPTAVRLPVDLSDRFPYRTGFSDEAAATGWLDAELANLVAMVEFAATRGPYRVAWLLADALGGYFWLRRRHGPQWLITAEAGLVAATAEGDRTALAAAHLNLSLALRCFGRAAEAIRHSTEALTISRQLGWRPAEASALSILAANHAELGNHPAALAAFAETIQVNRQIGRRAGVAGALTARAGLRFRLGQLSEALRDGLAALAAYRDVRNPAGQAFAHVNTALCYLHLGQPDHAFDHLTRSLPLFESVGERSGRNLAQCLLAKLHCDAGRYPAALQYADAALRTASQTDDPSGIALALIDLVEIKLKLGDHQHAVRDSNRAVELARQANRTHLQAHALIRLAETYLHHGEPDHAMAPIAAARTITQRHGYRLLEGLALTVLGEIQLAAGVQAAATEAGGAALTIQQETGYQAGQARARTLLLAAETTDR